MIPAIVLADFEDGYVPGLGGEGRQPESKITLVDSPVHSGKKAAKLSYVFRKDVKPRQYVEFWVSRQLSGGVASVSAWIFGDGSKQMLKLRAIDKTGEYLQYRYGVIDWKGWRHVTIKFGKPALEVSWGGDQNGKADAPLKGVCFLVDSAVRPAQSELIFDDITYSATGEPLDFVGISAKSDVLGNAFYGVSPEFSIQVRNGLDAPQKNLPVELRVLDEEGRELTRTGRAVSLPAKGVVDFSLSPSLPSYGLYRAVVAYRDREKVIPFSYLPSADTREADLASPFGVSMHFGHGSRGPIENNLKLASDMGIRWLRDDGSWGSIEREKGVYKVPPTFDRFLRTARKDWGCEPLIILDYSNSLYCKDRAVATEEERQAFANWAEFMAREYKDSVTYWEVWNEPNISFWQPTPNPHDYALLLKATYAAVKRGNPDAKVVAMVTAGIDLTFIEAVLSEGTVGYFDAVSVHPYRYPRAPEAGKLTMLGHLQKLVDLLAKYGIKDTPIYNSEVGWPNQDDPRGLPEATSANYLSRMYVQLCSIPQIRATFWYDFQNDGLKKDYNENNFGLLHNDFSPKAPAVAYRMTSLALKGRRFVRELDTKDETTRAYLFAGSDGTRVLAAWSTAGKGALNTKWRTGSLQLISAAGPMRTVMAPGGVYAAELSETPVFLVGQGQVELAKAVLSGEGVWTVPGRGVSLDLKIRNPLGTAVSGPISITAPAGWSVKADRRVLLDRRETASRTLVVQPPMTAKPGEAYLVYCQLNADDGTLLGALSLPVELRAAATATFTYLPESKQLHIEGTSPLATPPAIESAQLRFVSPTGEETTQDISGSLAWQEPKWFWQSKEGASFAADVPCPALTVAPTVAKLTVAFAGVPAAEAETTFNLWPVPMAAIVIDGKDDDWLGMTSVKLDTFDGPEKDKWTGPNDDSATVSLAWDLEALYVHAVVEDDQQQQPEVGGGVWRGDGIQLSLAPMQGKPEDRVEIGLTLTKNGPEAYRWTQKAEVLKNVKLSAVREGTTTRYEAAIPWTLLGGYPQDGGERRFAMVVNDRDAGDREGWLPLFGGLGWSKDVSKHGILKF
jgi:hypothetical protein